MELSIPRALNYSPVPSSQLLKTTDSKIFSQANLVPTRLFSTRNRHMLTLMESRRTISASLIQANGSSTAPSTATSPSETGARIGEVQRVTKETNVSVKINLDGVGVADSNTGIPFLDHMLDLAGKNSHHIIEATFKAFARALRQATEYDPCRCGTIPSSKGVLSRS